MLTVEHYTKRYGRETACNDISLTLEPGNVTVLLGPNGAGKSTLMKGIIGFLKYEGRITVDGRTTKDPAVRRILGYIPELPSLYPNLSVNEHMEFLARAYRLRDYKQRSQELLEKFELSDKKKKFGDELSKGMQQKLNICMGLLPEPDILLLDEPMIGLDPHAIKVLKEEIETMRAQGKTLLISTHIIDSVDMLWDRAIILQKGNMRANITKEEMGEKTLEQIFFEVTEGRFTAAAPAFEAEEQNAAAVPATGTEEQNAAAVPATESEEQNAATVPATETEEQASYAVESVREE